MAKKTNRKVGWWALRGSLVHRAVLHPGGHWFAVSTEDERQKYLLQVKELMQTLTTALKRAETLDDDDLRREHLALVGSLIDCGGPAWGAQWIANYEALPANEKPLVCQHAEHLADTLAEKLMQAAELNKWEYFLTEVSNPLKLVETLAGVTQPDPPSDKPRKEDRTKDEEDWTRRGVRADFLATDSHGRLTLIELKTGKIKREKPWLEDKYQEEQDKYQETMSAMFDTPVNFWLLHVAVEEQSYVSWVPHQPKLGGNTGDYFS